MRQECVNAVALLSIHKNVTCSHSKIQPESNQIICTVTCYIRCQGVVPRVHYCVQELQWGTPSPKRNLTVCFCTLWWLGQFSVREIVASNLIYRFVLTVDRSLMASQWRITVYCCCCCCCDQFTVLCANTCQFLNPKFKIIKLLKVLKILNFKFWI
jgi:hypothetical protein